MGQVIQLQRRRRHRRWRPAISGRRGRRPWRLARLLEWAVLLAIAGLLYRLAQPRDDLTGAFHVCTSALTRTCVIDGDTIRHQGTTIRVLDIDAPEVFSLRCEAEAARGRAATRRLTELMNQGAFSLVASGDSDIDRYGRTLRTIKRDGRSLGAILVAEGLARPWDGARRSWCD